MGIVITHGSGNYFETINQTTGIFAGGHAGGQLPFTISAWVQHTDYSATDKATPVSLNRGNENNHRYYIRSDANVTDTASAAEAVSYGTASGVASSGENMSEATWHLIVGVFNSDSSRTVYLDGSTDTGTDATVLSPSDVDSITIGSSNGGGAAGDSGDCWVAEIAIWDKALSTAEIDDLTTKYPTEVASGNRLHYWPCNTGGGDQTDQWGSIDLTQFGTTTTSGTHPSLTGGGSVAPLAGRHLQNMMSN